MPDNNPPQVFDQAAYEALPSVYLRRAWTWQCEKCEAVNVAYDLIPSLQEKRSLLIQINAIDPTIMTDEEIDLAASDAHVATSPAIVVCAQCRQNYRVEHSH